MKKMRKLGIGGLAARMRPFPLYAVEGLEQRVLLAAVSWTGNGGDDFWANGKNWSTGSVPQPADDVTIAIQTRDFGDIQIATPVPAIHSLNTIDSINVATGTSIEGPPPVGVLQVATTVTTSSFITLNGGTLIGGTYVGAAGSFPEMDLETGTLQGVTLNIPAFDFLNGQLPAVVVTAGLTLNSTITVGQSGDGITPGQINFQGTQTISGTGTIRMGVPQSTDLQITDTQGPATLTIGPGITIAGEGVFTSLPNDTLVNRGTISADVAQNVLTVSVYNLVNQGTLQELNGGTLNLIPANGGSTTVNGGHVTISGSFNPSSVTITGGELTINTATAVSIPKLTFSGGILDGTATLNITGTSSWTGGTMSGFGTTNLVQGVTLNVNAPAGALATRPFNNNGILNVLGGSLELDGFGSHNGAFAISQLATINFGGFSTQFLQAPSSLTGAGTAVFRGQGSTLVQGGLNLANLMVSESAVAYLAAPTGVANNLTTSGGQTFIGIPPTGFGFAQPAAASAATPAVGGNTIQILVQAVIVAPLTVSPSWQLQDNGLLIFQGAGPSVTLTSDATAPATMLLGGDVTFSSAAGTATVVSGGSGALPGKIDLGTIPHSLTTSGAADQLVLAAPVIDTGSIRVAGLGTTNLAGANTYSGGTTVVGTLEVDSPTGLGTGPVSFAGGTLKLRTGAGATFPNALASGAPNTSITLDVDGGAYQFASMTLGSALMVTGTAGGALTIAGPVTLPAAAQFAGPTVVHSGGVAVTFAGAVTGGVALTKADAGTLTLDAADSYTGTTTVTAGQLVLNSPTGGAIPADLLIDGSGAGTTVLFQLSSQIAAGHSVTFDATSGPATLNLNGFTQTLNTIGIVPLTPNVQNDIIALGSAAGALTVGGTNATFDFAGVFTGTGTLTKAGSGLMTLDAAQAFTNAAGLAVNGGTLMMTGAGSANTLSSLSINSAGGAKLDLGTGSLRINYPAPASDPVATIRSYLASGFAGGAWNGAGLMTSGGKVLGYADSAEPGSPVAGLAANQILVKYTRNGDANLDGTTNLADLLLLAHHYGTATGSWDQGDFNYDNTVGFTDLMTIARNYGKTATSAVSTTAAVTASVSSARSAPATVAPAVARHVVAKRHVSRRLTGSARRHGLSR